MGDIGMSLVATMFMILLHAMNHLHEVNGVSRGGRTFSVFKFTGSDEPRCAILDVPTETYYSVNRGQCISACNRNGWNWVNFIEDRISSSSNTGQCQLFSHQPRTTTHISVCTLYKAQSTVVPPEYMLALRDPELSVPYGVPINCTFPFTNNGTLYYGCAPITGCPIVNNNRIFLKCDTNETVAQVRNVTVSVGGQPTPVQSIFGWLIWMMASGNSFNWTLPYSSYKNGFRQLSDGNYWLGLEKVHQLTSSNQYRLRIELQDGSTLDWRSVEYWSFRIDPESPQNYALYVAGFIGDAGDGMNYAWSIHTKSNGIGFSAWDKDKDTCGSCNCAAQKGGGWWYRMCYWGLLTGSTTNNAWPIDNTQNGYRFPVIASRMMIKLKP